MSRDLLEALPERLPPDMSPDVVVARLAEAVGRVAGADGVMVYEALRYGGRVYFADVFATGAAPFCAAARALEGRSVLAYASPLDDPDHEGWFAEHHPTARFGAVTARDARRFGAWSMLWHPAGVRSGLALDVVHDGALIGGILAARCGGGPAFSRRSLAALRAVQDPLKGAFVAAGSARAQRSAPRGPVMFAFDPSGALLGAAHERAGWLSAPETVARIGAAAARFAAGANSRGTAFVRRAPVRFHRLSGALSLVVASVPNGERFRPGPRLRLTPTQRRVADAAMLGATIAEIARHLSMSPGTVHHHLKGIYERLGIGSRVELVNVLGG